MENRIRHYIAVDPDFCHGKPRFRGTRIPVTTVLELLEGGMTVEDILRGYPSLNLKAIQAALHYAVQRIENEEFLPLASGK